MFQKMSIIEYYVMYAYLCIRTYTQYLGIPYMQSPIQVKINNLKSMNKLLHIVNFVAIMITRCRSIPKKPLAAHNGFVMNANYGIICSKLLCLQLSLIIKITIFIYSRIPNKRKLHGSF